MKEPDDPKSKIAGYQVRERIFALLCITSIAIVSMWRLDDPENIIINIIVAISGFMAGRDSIRKNEVKKEE
jgi:hypothetical protein